MINPFVNTTERKLSKFELIKTVILAPIAIARLIITSVSILLMLLTLYIASIGYSSNEENLSKCAKCCFLINQFVSNFVNGLKRLCCKKKQNTTIYHEMSKIRRCLLFLVQLEARFIMFVLGYIWIKETFPNTKKIIMFPSYLERQGAPKICVANHVSFIDTFYFLSRCVPRSVVIQANVAGPFTWAMNAFSPILVPVTQKQRKQLRDPRDQIHRNLETDILKRPLIIFPEGGTTQSNGLIKFQDGAFLDMQTVQPVALKYTYKNFDPSWTNDVSPIWLMFRMCCQFYNCLSVDYYDPISPNPQHNINVIVIDADETPQPKEIQTSKSLIDNFKKKVFERYSNDPFFVQTPYTLSDSRITSKLFKIKKIPIEYVCMLMGNGKNGVSEICKKTPITREQLERLICRFYSVNPTNDKLNFDQFKNLFTMNSIDITKLFTMFKQNETIDFNTLIRILIMSNENDDRIISCCTMSIDDTPLYSYFINHII